MFIHVNKIINTTLFHLLRKTTYHEEHLAAVLVGQEEQAENVVVGDLVVERLAVQVNEVGEELDVVAAARRDAVELGERAYGVGIGRALYVGLGQYVLHKLLRRIGVLHVGGDAGAARQVGYVKANLHHGHLGLLVLVELEDGLVLAHVRVGHVLERYLEGELAVGLEAQRVADEVRLAPVPALDARLGLVDGPLERLARELLQLAEVALLEAVEAVRRAVLEHDLDAVALGSSQPAHVLDVAVGHLLELARLLVLHHDVVRLKLQLTFVLTATTNGKRM